MFVRRFENKDAKEVSDLIVTTLRVTNIKDYSSEYEVINQQERSR